MKLLINFVLVMGFSVFAKVSHAETISPAKAAELACHRLDRLVVLKKIDKTYLTRFEKIDVAELAGSDSADGKYVANIFQTAPISGNPLNLMIHLDAAGKVLDYHVSEGGSSGSELLWPSKDPVSLAEAGLHYVLDEQAKNEQLRPFSKDFQSLNLSQKKINGEVVAELKMTSLTTTAKLRLILDLNGKLLSKEILP